MPTFSDVYLRALAPRDKQYSVFDSSLPTFGLRVSKTTKTFVLKRKNSYITLGRFPAPLSLSLARTEARRLLAEFTLGRLRPTSLNYSEAVQQYLEDKQKGRRSRTVGEYPRLLNSLPLSGQLGDITDAEIIRVLSKIKGKQAHNHYLVALRVFFNWCIKCRYLTHNPTVAVSAHATPPRSRILTDDELRAIHTACLADAGTFSKIVLLLLYSGQRRGEIAAVQSGWINISEQSLCLPQGITKNGREHVFPLSQSSLDILQERLTEHVSTVKLSNSFLLFPARGKQQPSKPFNGWSKSKLALDRASGVTGWTLHDLRRTYRSNLGRIGVAPHVAERLVNHLSAQTDMQRVYDKWTYWPELKSAVDKYDEWLKATISS
jgi:integrase